VHPLGGGGNGYLPMNTNAPNISRVRLAFPRVKIQIIAT